MKQSKYRSGHAVLVVRDLEDRVQYEDRFEGTRRQLIRDIQNGIKPTLWGATHDVMTSAWDPIDMGKYVLVTLNKTTAQEPNFFFDGDSPAVHNKRVAQLNIWKRRIIFAKRREEHHEPSTTFPVPSSPYLRPIR